MDVVSDDDFFEILAAWLLRGIVARPSVTPGIFIAKHDGLELLVQGESRAQAVDVLGSAIRLYLASARRRGLLEERLARCGLPKA